MHARKTGALIRAAAVAGAIMGGGTDGAGRGHRPRGRRARPRLPDRRRHPRRRGRVRRSRQDRRQGRRRRQADLPGALRPRARRGRWPPSASQRAEATARRPRSCADSRLLGIGRWIVEQDNVIGIQSPATRRYVIRRSRLRLDQLVVDRGLAPSRERARALILAGQVPVGRPAGHQGRHRGGGGRGRRRCWRPTIRTSAAAA